MADDLTVLLEGEPAGVLTRLSGGRLRFAYDDTYRERSTATPLSLSMPPQIRTHTGDAVSAWLWGLLPDNERVLARWARELHASPSSAFSLLATPVGHDCAGAVQFVAAEDVAPVLTRPGTIEWLSDRDVAERLSELRQDATAWLGERHAGQFSLAGAQAKTALVNVEGRWGVPSGATPTSHILKPAVAGLDDHDLNEHLCLDAARRAGLIVARTRVERFGDETAIVVERYDRTRVAGDLLRVHQEDLCQALGVHPSRKYESDGGPGVRDVAKLLRGAMPPRAADDAIWRFLDALAWNWLIAGTDAHAKNYSVLLARDQVRLAPLYDIASALPYYDEHRLRFAMKIGGDYRVLPYDNTWPAAAQDLGLPHDAVVDRVRALAARAPDTFADAAAAPEVAALDRPLPARLTDLVTARVRWCERLLSAAPAQPSS